MHYTDFFRVNPFIQSLRRIIEKILLFTERYSLPVSLVFFFFGIGFTRKDPIVGEIVSTGISNLVNVYSYFVPFLLYFLITPALLKIVILAEKHGNGWLLSVLRQFTLARILAIVYSCIALSLIFQLPLFSSAAEGSFFTAMQNVGQQLLKALFFSTFLYGIYAAVLTMFIAQRFEVLKRFFTLVGDGIEKLGEYFILLSPLFMFALGGFLYHLPTYLEESVGENVSLVFKTLTESFATIPFLQNVSPRLYFIVLYFFIGLLTGALCIVWHILYVGYTKLVDPQFSFKRYIRDFWSKVYPLLWASSSETLAVPITLTIMKKKFSEVPSAIRQFVIPAGSYLGINGTLISVYVMGVVLAQLLGVHISFLQLIMSLPVIFILGYAVPGIPGELVIFAGTMSLLLGVPPQTAPLFLALYFSLQIGLPDSFRTGTNSTDSVLVAIVSARKFNLMHKIPEPTKVDLEPFKA